MKTFFFLITLLFSVSVTAEEAKDEWQNTTLSDATIKKIQESRFEYKKCVGAQLQKPAYLSMDSRKATEEIMKQCEPALGKIREVYIAEKIPTSLADRHLKQIRIQTTRKALQTLMFEQAAKNAGQP
ncbi:MAG: hypothetical protein FJ190_10520 [Gammaproteobacteria bacterium]|nr:hypothetical protein [Gammaproteobacteria bacterium]